MILLPPIIMFCYKYPVLSLKKHNPFYVVDPKANSLKGVFLFFYDSSNQRTDIFLSSVNIKKKFTMAELIF